MEARDARESRAFAAVPGTHRHPAAPRRTKGKAMNYVDGFVCAVPTANREKYRRHAEAAAQVFKAHGALNLVECRGDDVPDGKLTSLLENPTWRPTLA
jgi:Protein of unknown function (DUF1428)